MALTLPLVMMGCFVATDDTTAEQGESGAEAESGSTTDESTDSGSTTDDPSTTDDNPSATDDPSTTDDPTDDPTDPLPECGDGIAEGDEECDGLDLGGADCQRLGFDGGNLGCTGACTLDASGCMDVPPEFVDVHYYTSGNNTSMASITASCLGEGMDECSVIGPLDGGWDALEIGCHLFCPLGAQIGVQCDTGGQSGREIENISVVGDVQTVGCNNNNTDCAGVFTVIANMNIDCSITD